MARDAGAAAIVIAKAPRPGLCKTRLEPLLGAQGCADLQAALIRRATAWAAEVGTPYWMESALWEGAGVATLVCGPGGGGLHAADEWVDLEQVRLYASVLVDTISAFCA